MSVLEGAFALPPIGDGVSREGGSIVGDANDNGATVDQRLVDAIGNGNADGIRAEVVIMNRPGDSIPASAGVFEVSDEFAFFGINADDGQSAAAKALAQIGDVIELKIAVGTGIGGEFLLVDAQRVIHGMQQASDGVGRNRKAMDCEKVRNLIGGAAGPFQSRDGIAGGVMFEKVLDDIDYFGRFFSVGMRPAPGRRMRPVWT